MRRLLRGVKKPGREILEEAEAAGCTLRRKKKGIMVLGPGGSMMIHHELGGRNLQNARADLNRILTREQGART